jgi:hypothetical protein
MPFDAEAPVREISIVPAAADLGVALVFAADPAPEWAEHHPDRLLAFLYVSPRPCDALDALLKA